MHVGVLDDVGFQLHIGTLILWFSYSYILEILRMTEMEDTTAA